MTTTYTAVLSSNSSPQTAQSQFPTILACVKWAEAHGEPADCCSIYSASGKRVAQYRQPPPGSYPADCGVWVNAKIA